MLTWKRAKAPVLLGRLRQLFRCFWGVSWKVQVLRVIEISQNVILVVTAILGGGEFSLRETNSTLHLKMDGWNAIVFFWE